MREDRPILESGGEQVSSISHVLAVGHEGWERGGGQVCNTSGL